MTVRKAIFPAAGLGTRFLPVTKAQPKEMLPLVDKPTIQYGVEEAIAIATSGKKGPLHEVTDMVEKPPRGEEPSDLAILGRYVIAPAVFDELGRTDPGAGKEIQLTDAIKRTIGSHPVVAVEFEGDYYDTGTVAGYLRANLTMAMKREELRDELAPLVRELLGD